MRAMILAAGKGERMQPLTKTCPKPLLKVNGKPLIQYHIENLVSAGISEIVINHGIMGNQIEEFLGNGHALNAEILYSVEGNKPLETGGGIFQAIPLLEEDTFLVINADIWTDYPFVNLHKKLTGLAHLVLVRNPVHHPDGDFALMGSRVENVGWQKFTFSGIAVYNKQIFSGCQGGAFPLTPLIRQAVEQQQVTGEFYQGRWVDVGTPERLAELQENNDSAP